jgi:putative heme iron utilization protein
MQHDGRASLFVADPAAGRPQAGARLTVLVRAALPLAHDVAAVEACYFARFPGAEAMRQAHGFRVWRLEVDCVRWIAGFGEMGWIDRATWTGEPDALAADAAGIVSHMNEDHAGAVVELVLHLCALEAATAKVTAVDSGGFSVLAGDRAGAEHVVRLPFPLPATTPVAVRDRTVQMLQLARSRRG